MKFTVIGFECDTRRDKKSGEDVNFINLHLTHKSPKVSGYATRTEYFSARSAFYPMLLQYVNAGNLVGAECFIDSDVIQGKDTAYKQIIDVQITPKQK